MQRAYIFFVKKLIFDKPYDKYILHTLIQMGVSCDKYK